MGGWRTASGGRREEAHVAEKREKGTGSARCAAWRISTSSCDSRWSGAARAGDSPSPPVSSRGFWNASGCPQSWRPGLAYIGTVRLRRDISRWSGNAKGRQKGDERDLFALPDGRQYAGTCCPGAPPADRLAKESGIPINSGFLISGILCNYAWNPDDCPVWFVLPGRPRERKQPGIWERPCRFPRMGAGKRKRQGCPPEIGIDFPRLGFGLHGLDGKRGHPVEGNGWPAIWRPPRLAWRGGLSHPIGGQG